MPDPLPRYEYDPGTGLVTVDFEAPLARVPKFVPRARLRDVFGGKGRRQRNLDYIERVTELVHEFALESEVDAVETMARTHALLGRPFDFVPDRVAAPGTKIAVELLDDDFDPERQFMSLNRWRFSLRVRKEIA